MAAHSMQPTTSHALLMRRAFLGPMASAACPEKREPTTAPTSTADTTMAPSLTKSKCRSFVSQNSAVFRTPR